MTTCLLSDVLFGAVRCRSLNAPQRCLLRFIADCSGALEGRKTDRRHFSLVIKVFSNSEASRTEHANSEGAERELSGEISGLDKIWSEPAAGGVAVRGESAGIC